METSNGMPDKVFFPDIVDEKILTSEFLAAARDVLRTIEKLGKQFAPVRYDMQGNIDKLTSRYTTDKEGNSTLQDMILAERANETNLIATDALMWMIRTLHMILLFFEKIIEDHKTGSPTEDLVAFLRTSYKEALEPYHGWVVQQLFSLLSRMVPSRTQLLQALADGEANREDKTVGDMELYLVNLRKNVFALQKFYKIHNLENAVAVV